MRLSLRLLPLALALLAASPARAGGDVEAEGSITALTDETLTVEGLTFALTAATEIRDDDGPATRDDLAVGLTVEVEGETDTDGLLVALKIEIEDEPDGEVEVEGVITERADGALRVGAVWVWLSDATEIRDDDGPATRDDLVVGVYVEVDGAFDAAGQIVALRIEIEDDENEPEEDVEVEGPIEDLTASSLTVRGLTFVVTEATRVTADDDGGPIPFESLLIGDLVEVEGAYADDGALVALEIEVEDFEDEDIEITGAIEALSADGLVVAGLAFAVTGETVVLDDDEMPVPFESLLIGQVVEVHAVIEGDGTRRATKIEVEDRVDDEVEVKAVLDAVGDEVVVVLGVPFAVTAATVRPGGLLAGDVVELHARRAPTGDLVATRIEREDAPASEVRLRGPVTAVDPAALSVIGVPFGVTSATVIVDRDGAPTTLDAITAGASVRLYAVVEGAGWRATRVEIRAAARASGRVASADGAGFTVGGLAVRLSVDTQIVGPDGAPRTRVEAGQTVRATGTTAGGGLDATTVAVLSDATATAAEPGAPVAATLALAPNPLAGSGRLDVALAAPAALRVVVVSALGREVARIDRPAAPAGSTTVALDVSGLPAGVYLVRVLADGRPAGTLPMTVVR